MRSQARFRTQSGFSMVEMLMVALVMAIGLLGVASMQLVAIKAATGSQNLSTAALVADRIMDQVEVEGRLCWLNQTSSGTVNTGNEPPNLLYFAGGTVPNGVTQSFDIKGNPVDAGSASTIFTATITGAAVTSAGGTTGRLADVTVVVQFTDIVQGTQQIKRSMTLARRILYA